MTLGEGFASCFSAILINSFEKLTERNAGLLCAARANWPPSYRWSSQAVLLLVEANCVSASAPGELQSKRIAHMAKARLAFAAGEDDRFFLLPLFVSTKDQALSSATGSASVAAAALPG